MALSMLVRLPSTCLSPHQRRMVGVQRWSPESKACFGHWIAVACPAQVYVTRSVGVVFKFIVYLDSTRLNYCTFARIRLRLNEGAVTAVCFWCSVSFTAIDPLHSVNKANGRQRKCYHDTSVNSRRQRSFLATWPLHSPSPPSPQWCCGVYS